jgi:hypothetical protein
VGTTVWATGLAVRVARGGERVLFLDRDNPPTRRRLKAWGVDTPNLKLSFREQVPPLTDAPAWAAFPYQDYDLVIIDSLDSATEGVRDSAKGQALAPLLDIAHRDGGPAVLVLGNTVKTAEHGRGRGVIENRADIIFEVRDATGFTPTGKRPWWAQGAADWSQRATRSNKQATFRLAFICTKNQDDEQPSPFVLELDLAAEPWACRDVTNPTTP